MKIIITEMKTTLEESKNRLQDTEEQISKLEDRVVEITEVEQKRIKINGDSLGVLQHNISMLTFTLQWYQKKKSERKGKRTYLKT